MEPAEELQRGADRIASLILYSDLPWVDVAIEIEKLRERCMEVDPEHLDLFENLYESRFHRLWEQWREEEQMRRYRRI